MTTHLGFPLETVAVFVVLSVGAIAIDLFAHRSDKPMSLKSAALWSVFWIAVSLTFGGYLWFHHGSETASGSGALSAGSAVASAASRSPSTSSRRTSPSAVR